MKVDVEIELEHIKLEIENNRGQHLRHFIDQYYCYKFELLTSKGRAKWEKLMEVGVISFSAQGCNRKELVKEHVVPISFIKMKLLELRENDTISNEAIAEVLDRYFVIGTITKEEDKILRCKGLSKSMPSEFSDPNDPYFEDVFSRYRVAQIEFKRQDEYKFNQAFAAN